MTEEELVREYYPLVVNIAKKYPHLHQEDLIQEGMIGLLTAWRRFDPEKGSKFSTYAYYYIKKQILAAIKKENPGLYQHLSQDSALAPDTAADIQEHGQSALQLPPNMPELEKRILHYSFGEELSLQQVAKKIGIRVEKVRYLKDRALRRLRVLIKQDSA
ncbi:MAG: hypothetical protein PWP64_969 [Candidatus Cloacimonadota bacterium]|nr:hypothetical protein [Candidatus Cloacimonadota bacterium]